MKYILCSICTLFLSSIVVAQAKDSVYYNSPSENYFEKEGRASVLALIRKDEKGLYHRTSYFIFSKTQATVSTSYDIKDSVREGEYLHYYPNGILEHKWHYKNGKKHGECVSFHENGMISDSSNFINGIPVGGYFSWYISGNPKVVNTFDTLGNGSGIFVHYFDNGNISFKGRCERGYRKIGPWTYYHLNGNKASVLVYPKLDESILNSTISLKYDTLEEFAYDSEEIPTTTKCYDTLGIEQVGCDFINMTSKYNRGVNDWTKYLESTLSVFYMHYKHTGASVPYFNKFTIDENGKVKDFVTSTSFNVDLDTFVKKTILNAPKWKPALHNNRVIPYTHKQSIVFVSIDNY